MNLILATMPLLKFSGILYANKVKISVSTDKTRCINFISMDEIIEYLHHKPGVKRELRIDFYSSAHLRVQENEDSMKQIIPYLYKLAGKLAKVSFLVGISANQ